MNSRTCIIWLCLAISATTAHAQIIFNGYTISDYLVTAVHPDGCSSAYVLGPPDDSIWVNFNNGDVMSGAFASSWTDATGNDILLETGYHRDNYSVRLLLSGGQYSAAHPVAEADWTQISNITWQSLFTNCTASAYVNRERYILPLDFNQHFSLASTDIVTGIEITFLTTAGLPDLAGVYIIAPPPCNIPDYIMDTLCQGETLMLDVTTPNATYLWQDNSTNATFNVTQQGVYWVQIIDNCGISTDTFNITYNSAPTSFTYTIAVVKPELGNGAVRVAVSGGAPPYLYSLDSLSFQTGNTFTSLGLGTYQVYVTDNNGCTGQGTFTIDETNCNCTNH